MDRIVAEAGMSTPAARVVLEHSTTLPLMETQKPPKHGGSARGRVWFVFALRADDASGRRRRLGHVDLHFFNRHVQKLSENSSDNRVPNWGHTGSSGSGCARPGPAVRALTHAAAALATRFGEDAGQ